MHFDIPTGAAVLERTPRVLHAMLDGLDERWTRADEGPDTWSPHVVVGHLIHGERTDWIPRARIILAQESDRRFTPFDRFAQLRENQQRPLAELLAELAALRKENVATLAGWRIDDRQLALTGEHPAFGTVTLGELLATWVAHDLSHLAQVARVMARQYRDAVGPWREYLPILGA